MQRPVSTKAAGLWMKGPHVGVALIILAVLASDSWGQSQRPPDAEQTKAAQQPAATDQRGTAQSPAMVKILPPDDADAKAKQEAEDRAAKDSLDWNTIKLGISAIVVAFLQFIAIGIQGWFLWRTVKVSEIAARVADESCVYRKPYPSLLSDRIG